MKSARAEAKLRNHIMRPLNKGRDFLLPRKAETSGRSDKGQLSRIPHTGIVIGRKISLIHHSRPSCPIARFHDCHTKKERLEHVEPLQVSPEGFHRYWMDSIAQAVLRYVLATYVFSATILFAVSVLIIFPNIPTGSSFLYLRRIVS